MRWTTWHEVIELIRRSRTVETAHNNLKKRFKLSDLQAQAILNMPLRRLAALERKKIEDGYKELQRMIRFLEELLSSPQKMRDLIIEELTAVKEQYADQRRTLIVEGVAGSSVKMAELLPDEATWVVLTENGLLSRTFDDQPPKVTTAVKDPPRIMLSAEASEILYLFTADGMAATVPVHQLPQTHDFAQGTPFQSITPLTNGQEVVAALTRLPGLDDGYLFLGSEMGMVKRAAVEDLPGLTAHPFQVIGLNDDALGWAAWTTGAERIVLVTAGGSVLRKMTCGQWACLRLV